MSERKQQVSVPASDSSDVKITPEMVRAGEKVMLDEYDPDDTNLARFVRRLYFVMASTSRKRND